MKFRNEHMTLTQIGEVFGVSNQQVGKWLVKLGLRTPALKPSTEAFSGGYVTPAPSRGQGYVYIWHSEKTVGRLVAAGHRVAAKPCSELLVPPPLCGPFECQPDPDFGHRLVGAGGQVAVWVSGEENARVVCWLLNLADRNGKLQAPNRVGSQAQAAIANAGEASA